MKFLLLTFIIVVCFLVRKVYSQQTLSKIIAENRTTFHCQDNRFEGKGWEEILAQINTHRNILIGEDHFFNEIPLFISKVTSEVKFDSFFCEIDPYSASIIEQKINSLTENELDQYLVDLSNTFSFYALSPEFNLLKKLVLTKTKIIGTDQIMMTADKLMASKLLEITNNSTAKQIYTEIKKSSTEHFDLFMNKKGSPYFVTDEFEQNLKKLDSLKLSPEEKSILESLKLSRKIYASQDHHLRIQLMKNNMLNNIELLNDSKNLFKYGAIHMNKSESLLGGYDIGNLISNLTDANFESSLHICIIGKSGFQGTPFKGMDAEKLDPLNDDLKHLSCFFDSVEGNKWHLFNTTEILKKVKTDKVKIKDKKLLNTLYGFDYLIVIPEVSAAKFIN